MGACAGKPLYEQQRGIKADEGILHFPAPLQSAAAHQDDALAAAAGRRIIRRQAHCTASGARLGSMMTLSAKYPRRAAERGAGEITGAPSAPVLIYQALLAAVQSGNTSFATTDPTVAEQLHEDILYTDLRGECYVGRDATLAAMNEGIERLLSRIAKTTRSGTSGVVTTRHMRLSASPPRRSPTQAHTWIVVFSFKLFLMNVRIQEEYVVSADGLVTRLTRTMAK